MHNMKLLKLLSNSPFLAINLTITIQTAFGALTEKPEDVVAKVGTRVVIKCSTDLPKPVKWSRVSSGSDFETDIYIGSGVFDPQFTDRCSIFNSSSLVIKSVSLKDAGQYTCYDEHGFGYDKGHFASANLTVIEDELKCRREGNFNQETVFSIVTGKIKINCKVTYRGNASPDLQWSLRNRETDESGISLQLHSRSSTTTEGADSTLDSEISLDASTVPDQIYIRCNVLGRGEILLTWLSEKIVKPTLGQDFTSSTGLSVSSTSSTGSISIETVLVIIVIVAVLLYLLYHCLSQISMRCATIRRRRDSKSDPVNNKRSIAATIGDPPTNDDTKNFIHETATDEFMSAGTINNETSVRQRLVPRSKSRLLSHLKTLNVNPRTKAEYFEEVAMRPVLLSEDLHTSEQIIGVTVVDDKVYVIRQGQKEINVYDSRHGSKLSDIPMYDIDCLHGGLAGCSDNKALYMSDSWRQCILRVDLTNNFVTRWETGKYLIPRGLSVTAQRTVLVTMWLSGTGSEGSVVEVTSEGKRLREIRLDKRIKHARQTVQLSSDQFVVSHGKNEKRQGLTFSMHRVCVINPQGNIIKCFGSEQGGGEGLLDHPVSIAMDVHRRCIFVADCKSHRIVLLNTNLEYLGQVLTHQLPYCLCFDSCDDRLFIGDKLGRLSFINYPL